MRNAPNFNAIKFGQGEGGGYKGGNETPFEWSSPFDKYAFMLIKKE